MNQTQVQCMGGDSQILIGAPRVLMPQDPAVQLLQHIQQTPIVQNPATISKPATAPLPIQFNDPRDIAMGENLLKLLQNPKNPKNPTKKVTKESPKNDVPISQNITKVTNLRYIPMPMQVPQRPTVVYSTAASTLRNPGQSPQYLSPTTQTMQGIIVPSQIQRVTLPQSSNIATAQLQRVNAPTPMLFPRPNAPRPVLMTRVNPPTSILMPQTNIQNFQNTAQLPMNVQVPIQFVQYKHPAKTITTPSYSNVPRMCPAKIPSPNIVPTKFPLQNTPAVVAQNKFNNPFILRPNTSTVVTHSNKRFSPYFFKQTAATQDIVQSLPENNVMPHLRQLLTYSAVENKELADDPIGLLVPEVQIVEDESQQVTIPQWSPVKTNSKRKCDQTPTERAKKKPKTGSENSVEMKEAVIVLDKLNMSLIKNGSINVKKVNRSKLFLPRKKIQMKKEPKDTKDSKDSKEDVSPEIVFEKFVQKTENHTLTLPTVPPTVMPQQTGQKMKCLVYKSINFTHVIPLQDVISIPNELLEDLESLSPSPCQQLEDLLNLVSATTDDSDVEPEFEAMDLNTTTSVSLNSEALDKLASKYKAMRKATKDLKVNKLRDKLMTALATSDRLKS